MKVAQIVAILAIATAATGAYAASSDNDTGMSATRQWYQAGDREIQSEQAKVVLDREGFPQYAN